mgnify:CR=1 FL=1
MASKGKGSSAFVRVMPVVLKVVALCAVALVALLLLLPAPPERSGGVTSIAKHVPTLRDTVNPLGKTPDEAERSITPAEPERPVAAETPLPVPPEPEQPAAVALPAAESEAPPAPRRKPENKEAPPPAQDGSGAPLPWTGDRDVASVPPSTQPDTVGESAGGLPARADVRDWLRSQAWEFLGGVDPQGNILYRFEVWLDAPAGMLDGVKSVTYVYDAPSATPGERSSDNAKNGFRARFGSLACSKKVTVTLTMADGRTQETVADGCRALN